MCSSFLRILLIVQWILLCLNGISQTSRIGVASSLKDDRTSKDVWHTASALGGQIGYSKFGPNQFDLGINYYWSKMQNDPDYRTNEVYHTFGPFASAVLLSKGNTNVFGTQIGFDYHYYYTVCPRVNILYENFFNSDQRVAIDGGISTLGLFVYLGYHYPIGNYETEGIARFRLGVKYVFNSALLKTSSMNWH